MAAYDVKCVLEIEAELGECPTWNPDDQSLYWIDIDNKTINRFQPASGKNTAWDLPSMPGCFALRDPDGAVIAARDGIYDFDFGTGALKQLEKAPFDTNLVRFNDGRPDRQGRLWAGTLPLDFAKASDINGAFYRYDGRSFDPVIPGVVVANGTAFSPDGKLMYRAESVERRIYA
jgi:sugar lactone lactonase YvrE